MRSGENNSTPSPRTLAQPSLHRISMKIAKLLHYPHGSKKGSRFESFREAWWFLDPELKPICEEKPH